MRSYVERGFRVSVGSGRVVEFLGLNGSADEGGRVPRWRGSPPGTAWRHVVLWAVIAFAAFRLFDARMPDDDGFGGFVPGWLALLVWVVGITLTERATLRDPSPGRGR